MSCSYSGSTALALNLAAILKTGVMHLTKVLIAVCVFLLLGAASGYAQSGGKPSTTYPEFSPDPSSRSPYGSGQTRYNKKEEKKRRRALKKRNKGNDMFMTDEEARKEFWDRQKNNARERKRMARKMKKPQYSDPSYFGHKRKPKIRPVGKRKLCKECGIVH